jgi:hypothetical protein
MKDCNASTASDTSPLPLPSPNILNHRESDVKFVILKDMMALLTVSLEELRGLQVVTRMIPSSMLSIQPFFRQLSVLWELLKLTRPRLIRRKRSSITSGLSKLLSGK